ncbi:phosphonatase-like hydrolase [Pseudoclavibacter sp. CFCC 13611]|uniref:phosphonatase-like hydrolase n=1 Tax=Pseudoclavibacter sp. CFCC 13611 TaxID=2615178 RepID=UPI0013013105|nr:phosphonatase-like hydrolase [Pseudoclavibacter sp. CFCC 13611]KAB1663951.1 phosphonatase-like hydrolase [Pseudoclavibacter sp. CFCC 13611]
MHGLFALDIAGTTVDEGNIVYDVLRRAVTEAGATIDESAFADWTGVEKQWAIRNLLRLGGADHDDARVAEVFASFTAMLQRAYRDTPPRPVAGVETWMREARNAGAAVVLTTGFARPVADALLEGLGWRVEAGDADATLDGLICATEVRAGRPAPYLIQHAMELAGVEDVVQVVAAGDTAADVLAARHAGVRAVGVLSGAGSREQLEAAGADVVVDSVIDLSVDIATAATR